MKTIKILNYAMLDMDLPIVEGAVVFMKRKVNLEPHLIIYHFDFNDKFYNQA